MRARLNPFLVGAPSLLVYHEREPLTGSVPVFCVLDIAVAEAVGAMFDGPALMDWCEANYVHSSRIAEFWNTWTNVPYCIVGLATIFCLPQHAAFVRLRGAGVALCGIGIGSMAFHGTLTRAGQAADELAIVYWEACCCFAKRRTLTVMARFHSCPKPRALWDMTTTNLSITTTRRSARWLWRS